VKKVFADACFYQALLLVRDSWHRAAMNVFRNLRADVVTTDYILLELGALMSRGHARHLYVDFVRRIRLDRHTSIVPATPELMEAGLALFAERMDKEWSLADCISMVVMRRQGLAEALTSDKHFEQAQFQALLK
jgi:predicted nucleic acid-binding protein